VKANIMSLVFLVVIALPCKAITSKDTISIIPQPTNINYLAGNTKLKSPIYIFNKNLSSKPSALLIQSYLQQMGIRSEITDQKPVSNFISLITNNENPKSEAYSLQSTKDAVTISSESSAGVFYGAQTLFQIFPLKANKTIEFKRVSIDDHPRFVWRGMHLDVSRHFFPVTFIKKYIDIMSTYKMNTFHWHLTDDQGWRIEIKKYPKLTQIGSKRSETIVAKNFSPYVGNKTPVEGFYTQEEILDVIEYAKQRHITIVPEIEMPGHSLAALAAYPELACTQETFETGTKWGVYEDIYCPSEYTFEFLQNVLAEVIALFPSDYIHIGGDEAPKTRWKTSELAQNVIKREGLKDEHELQSYFIKRIEKYLISQNRKLIGWDEILEGGLAPEAAVMSWRGEAGGIIAAEQGHDVVMTPGHVAYFDHYQANPATEPLAIGGFTSLRKVYDYEPIPASLNPNAEKHILGAQANVWTEYMPTSKQVEYMVFPRLLAMAETIWSAKKVKDWQSFSNRIHQHYPRLDSKNINYRIPEPMGLKSEITLGNNTSFSLSSQISGDMYYTLDGTEPDRNSIAYHKPVILNFAEKKTFEVKAKVFLANGKSSSSSQATYSKVELKKAVKTSSLKHGVNYQYLPGAVSKTADINKNTAEHSGVLSKFEFPIIDERPFSMIYHGFINIKDNGIYDFFTRSDDGSVLLIDGEIVVNNDALQSATVAVKGQVALEKGTHLIKVLYFDAGGGEHLTVEMAAKGQVKQEISATQLLIFE